MSKKKQKINLAYDIADALINEGPLGRFLCGEYEDGSVRSIPDAIRGEMKSPDQKRKKKKAKKRKEQLKRAKKKKKDDVFTTITF